jgi:hypothetical protein
MFQRNFSDICHSEFRRIFRKKSSGLALGTVVCDS